MANPSITFMEQEIRQIPQVIDRILNFYTQHPNTSPDQDSPSHKFPPLTRKGGRWGVADVTGKKFVMVRDRSSEYAESSAQTETGEVSANSNNTCGARGWATSTQTKQRATQSRDASRSEAGEALIQAANLITSADYVHIAACGTSLHAGMTLALLLEKHCKIRCKHYIASEFETSALLHENELLIVLTQSGETTDTLNALKHAKSHGLKSISICNADLSTIARTATINLPILAGVEKSVASTKAYCAQVLVGALLANQVHENLFTTPLFLASDMSKLALQSAKMGLQSAKIGTFARDFGHAKKVFFLGSGVDFFTALEAALKVKETNLMHAEGFATREFRHGPAALVDENTLLLRFENGELKFENLTIQDLKNTTPNSIQNSPNLALDTPNSTLQDPILTHKSPNLDFVTSIIPAQILALKLAKLKNLDPDNPRNLTKTVL